MEKHRCGGILSPVKVKVKKKTGLYFQNFTVDGYRCDNCGEEIIERDTAFAIDEAVESLKKLWSKWKIPGDTRETPSLQQNPVGTAFQKLSVYQGTINDRPY